MKKLFTISLLFIYLFSTTELSQLLKLPLLIEHYLQHKEEDKNMSLLAFLSMHYAEAQVFDADYDQDMKLPFKTHDGCSLTILSLCAPDNLADFNLTEILFAESPEYITRDIFISSSFLSNIWQPPRSF